MNETRKHSQTLLNNVTFGQRIAEEERAVLAGYFVETDQWRQLFSGKIDIIYGAKGSGKSALYFLLSDKHIELEKCGIGLVAAENPRGATAFRALTEEPPPDDERDFINFWKLYLLSLVGAHLQSIKVKDRQAAKLIRYLGEHGLLGTPGGLKGLLKEVRDHVRRFSAVAGEFGYDPTNCSPKMTATIMFQNPSHKEREEGALPIEELFAMAEAALVKANRTVWVILDRLDVAFADNALLERNALRSLFMAYNDLQSFTRIRLKIFLRGDIWKTITSEGFREASHITRCDIIQWSRNSLLNLIVRRSLQNAAIRECYEVGDEILEDVKQQEKLWYSMFPKLILNGSDSLPSLEWVMWRTQDGSKETAPREIIHFLNSVRDKQLRRLELGEDLPADNNLFSAEAMREAMKEVSKVRLEQTLYAEYPSDKDYCEALRGTTIQHTLESLSRIWWRGEANANTLKVARRLQSLGFFESGISLDAPLCQVSPVYRDALEMREVYVK